MIENDLEALEAYATWSCGPQLMGIAGVASRPREKTQMPIWKHGLRDLSDESPVDDRSCYHLPASNTYRMTYTKPSLLLKSELKRRNLTYADLAEKLRLIDIKANERNIANKINRGNFQAIFFVQCMVALDCKTVRLD